MKLKELRKFVQLTECLDENTSISIDFCGYTADNDFIEFVEVIMDEDCDKILLGIQGDAYER